MKRYRRGTHRIAPPAATLARIAGLARSIGVTRLADVTGLDRIGLPVFQAIRPLARSLAVSQGKGATADAARVSALMEAIELHHAETVPARTTGPATAAEAALWSRMTPATAQPLPFRPDTPRGWIDATDLLCGGHMRMPHGLATMDCTQPREPDLWPNTNGLASGNDHVEAVVSALCEAIERDAHARWMAAAPRTRRATAIDPLTIDDRLARSQIARVQRAGLRLALWDMSGAHGVAVIGCAIVEPGTAEGSVLPPGFGAGCHPHAPVALARAIGEAAQTRATLIAGSRDDLSPAHYADPGGQRTALAIATRAFGGGALRDWRQVPSIDLPSPAADRDHLLRACTVAGATAIPCATLTCPSVGVDVVKLIVPGFGDHDRPSAFA